MGFGPRKHSFKKYLVLLTNGRSPEHALLFIEELTGRSYLMNDAPRVVDSAALITIANDDASTLVTRGT